MCRRLACTFIHDLYFVVRLRSAPKINNLLFLAPSTSVRQNIDWALGVSLVVWPTGLEPAFGIKPYQTRSNGKWRRGQERRVETWGDWNRVIMMCGDVFLEDIQGCDLLSTKEQCQCFLHPCCSLLSFGFPSSFVGDNMINKCVPFFFFFSFVFFLDKMYDVNAMHQLLHGVYKVLPARQ